MSARDDHPVVAQFASNAVFGGAIRAVLDEIDTLRAGLLCSGEEPQPDDAYQLGYDAGHADGYNDGRTDRYGPAPSEETPR